MTIVTIASTAARTGALSLVLATLATALLPALPGAAAASGQGFTLDPAVEVVTRHIYRGNQFGDAAQAQPSLTLTGHGFTSGVWGSHPLGEDESMAGPAYKEVVFWAAYEVGIGEAGVLVPYVQTHYDVGAGSFLDADSHFLQAQLSWIGPAALPLDAMVGWVFYNDPDDSVYLEAGYRTAVRDAALRFFVGGTPAASPFNGTAEAAVTNLGVSSTWAFPVTEDASVLLGVRFIVNPHTGQVFPILSLGL